MISNKFIQHAFQTFPFLIILFFLVCSIDRDNPYDIYGGKYDPPKVIIDSTGEFLGNHDTIHFSFSTLMIKGNTTECRFQTRIDTNAWSGYQNSGTVTFTSIADGSHTIYIHTMYQGGIDTITDSVSFEVVTFGYLPRFRLSNDTTMMIDTGAPFIMLSSAESTFPVTYTWIKDSIILDKQQSDSFSILRVQKSDEGPYQCIARNQWGADTSRRYMLTTKIPIFTYKVIYIDNNSTVGSIPVDNKEYLKGDPVVVRGNIGNLKRPPFSFAGWNTFSDGSGTAYAPGVEFNIGAHDAVLYARWTQNPLFRVTYDGNGIFSGTPPVDSNAYERGAIITVKGNTGQMVSDSFTFAGWNTRSDGTGIAYASGMEFNIGEHDVTLYARWTIGPVYSIVYNGNGNESGSAPVDANHYEQGSTVTIRGNTGNLLKNQFTLAGWNTSPDGKGISYPFGSEFLIGTSNVSLFANWTQSKTYTIIYNGNGNTNGTVPKDLVLYVSRNIAHLKNNTGVLERTGYTFAGWRNQSDSSKSFYKPGDSILIDTSNIVFKAEWIIDTFSVSFHTNGGTILSPEHVCYMATLSDTVFPKRDGYLFSGWYIDSLFSGEPFEIRAPITKSLDLYAKWLRAYSIIYNANGGKGTAPVDTMKYLKSQTGRTLRCDNLKRIGYEFTGWNRRSDGAGLMLAPDSLIIIDTADVVLFAIWKKSSPCITTISFIATDTVTSVHFATDSLLLHDSVLTNLPIGPHPIVRISFDKPIGDLIVYNQADSFYSVIKASPDSAKSPYYDCTLDRTLLLTGNKLMIRVSSEGNLIQKRYTLIFDTPLWGTPTFISVMDDSIQNSHFLKVQFNTSAQLKSEDRTEGFIIFRNEIESELNLVSTNINYAPGNQIGQWTVINSTNISDTSDVSITDTSIHAGKTYYYRVIPFARTENGNFVYYKNIAIGTNRSMETHPIILHNFMVLDEGIVIDSLRANQFIRDTATLYCNLPSQITIIADFDSMPVSCSVKFSASGDSRELTFEKTYFDTNKTTNFAVPRHRFKYVMTLQDLIPLGNVVVTIAANVDNIKHQNWFIKGFSKIGNALTPPVAINQAPETTLLCNGQWESVTVIMSGFTEQITEDPRTKGIVIFRSSTNSDTLDLSTTTTMVNPTYLYSNSWIVDTIIENTSLSQISYMRNKLNSGTTYYFKAVPYGYNEDNLYYSYANPTDASSAATWKIVVRVSYPQMYVNDDGDGAGCAEFWQRLWVNKIPYGQSTAEAVYFNQQHDGMGAWCGGGTNYLNWSVCDTMGVDDSLLSFIRVLEDDGDAWDEAFDDVLFNDVLYSTRIRTLISNITASAMGKGIGFERNNPVVSGTLPPNVPTIGSPVKVDFNETRGGGDGPTVITVYCQLMWWFEK